VRHDAENTREQQQNMEIGSKGLHLKKSKKTFKAEQ
jgi:hypothetical protein